MQICMSDNNNNNNIIIRQQKIQCLMIMVRCWGWVYGERLEESLRKWLQNKYGIKSLVLSEQDERLVREMYSSNSSGNNNKVEGGNNNSNNSNIKLSVVINTANNNTNNLNPIANINNNSVQNNRVQISETLMNSFVNDDQVNNNISRNKQSILLAAEHLSHGGNNNYN